MVWNSAQTPLYQAVRAHNERNYGDSEFSEKQTEQHSEKQCSKPQCFEEKRFEKQCSECSKPRESAREQIHNSPKPRGIDRDMLLILMVIFILQSEKADEGLILALLLTMIL